MKISIITVNYNNCTGLRRTIGSVREQTYKEVEYIIIDGGSTDGSVEVIKENEDCVHYWISEKDNGIYDAMNKGLAKVAGDYCLFLNSGDYLCNQNVLSKVWVRENYKEDLIIGKQKYYNAVGATSVAWSIDADSIDERFFWSNTFPHQSTFIKTNLLKQMGGYDLKYKICADWAFWYVAVIEKKCSLRLIDVPVSFMEEGGVSRDMEKCRAEMAEFLMVHHQMNKEDWVDISKRYSEALGYRRAMQSFFSQFLLRLAMRLNKR